ncbi:carbohydrate ABC transporter permease [Sphaerochaeta sp.]|jgi:ABC-type glycerol-3-phosphate transport system permease component|uniref:carbohydrate ABC transporter permease n=1 Tax=Sphaerochaeta sp. TaxID=1972642 RepID=UPI00258321C0|nr:carbohydrate ABC transporter permease [Sphaerochaeta sp.]MDD3456446.1 carbohydrate ABC transporter permease [Sphaerochaeta sp.]
MKGNKLVALVLHMVLALVALVMLYPFLWMVFSSFKTNAEIVQNPLSLFPKAWSPVGYRNIAVLGGNSIWHYFKNSVIIAVSISCLTVLATSFGGYALYRNRKLPFFALIEKSFMVSMMYPAVLLLIPLYVVVVKMGLYGTNNFGGIILASSTGAWGAALPFFLAKQFFASVPYALIEAATIDGANEMQIFRRVMLPVMFPVLATSFLISFLTSWGTWLPVLMLSKDMSTYTLAAMLVNLNSDLGVDLSQTAALSTVLTLPVVLVFLITQRRVMDGIAAGSVKG